MDRYAVVGNPIAHSKSPQIHRLFAEQTGQTMTYEALLAPLDGFVETVASFRAQGGLGMNVTVPFKLEAHALAERLTPRAQAAGAVNTLAFGDEGMLGDNTDGAGLVRDLEHNLDCRLAGASVLLLGAGGAARGALLPLLSAGPKKLVIANRTPGKALALAEHFRGLAPQAPLEACGFEGLAGLDFDIVINATAASLAAEAPELPPAIYASGSLAYDMMYGATPTAFLVAADRAGAARLADGLGMLVEQAAESFALWRGVRPDTTPVLAELRRQLAGG